MDGFAPATKDSDADCYLHLTGRIKDIIIRGGENIAPHEVDEILLRHPAVAAAVTFGCAHPTLGEEVAAAVVLHESHSATESILIKHCREFWRNTSVPRKFIWSKVFPPPRPEKFAAAPSPLRTGYRLDNAWITDVDEDS
jgi:acyl-CoA synthetase (AMP-forming)/AMP-acid ligase II